MALGDLLRNRDDPPVVPVAAWRAIVALGLSLAGFGVSIYLTIDHFAKIAPVCSGNGLINCEKVTTSGESYFLHIPVALLGLLFYTALVAINSPWAWRSADRRVHLLRLVMLGGAMCFVLWLISAELLIIGNICLWCSSVHVITFFLFVLVLATTPRMLSWGAPPDDGYYEDDEDEDDDGELVDDVEDAGFGGLAGA
jgi:uncharacterized membrane protein